MIEFRIHGRGGQGAVVASNILASALLKEGKYGQSFPLFGGERRGAPVTAYLRAGDKHFSLRGEIYEPDHVIVLDPTLIKVEQVTRGLKKGGWIVINSSREPKTFDFGPDFRVATVDASLIAAKHRLGAAEARIVNTAMLGAVVGVSHLVSLDALLGAIREEAPAKKEENVAAAKEAYEFVRLSTDSV